jgi:hypothetical protein
MREKEVRGLERPVAGLNVPGEDLLLPHQRQLGLPGAGDVTYFALLSDVTGTRQAELALMREKEVLARDIEARNRNGRPSLR